jgi:putative ATPase
MADLFASEPEAALPEAAGPLADRLRPRQLHEVVGQYHLTGPEGAIGRMVAAGKLSSMILWGPPGTGKTTIARLLADAVGLRFVAISAVFSGVADLKKVFAEAREHARTGTRTLLFVDEIHRFNRAQQDGFLPYVEDGTVILVGATTENPSFELNAALLADPQPARRCGARGAARPRRSHRGPPAPAGCRRPRRAHRIGRRRWTFPAQPGGDAFFRRDRSAA